MRKKKEERREWCKLEGEKEKRDRGELLSCKRRNSCEERDEEVGEKEEGGERSWEIVAISEEDEIRNHQRKPNNMPFSAPILCS